MSKARSVARGRRQRRRRDRHRLAGADVPARQQPGRADPALLRSPAAQRRQRVWGGGAHAPSAHRNLPAKAALDTLRATAFSTGRFIDDLAEDLTIRQAAAQPPRVLTHRRKRSRRHLTKRLDSTPVKALHDAHSRVASHPRRGSGCAANSDNHRLSKVA